MNRCVSILWLPIFLMVSVACGQISSDCSTAIPICNNTPVNGGTNGFGMDDFGGAATSGCLEQTLSGAIESNSAWYRFRTGASGQLGFNIGFDASEDWDFALYRASDCANLGEPIRCNFFDNRDNEVFMGVGENPTGATGSVLYEDWLQVEPGEDYYLLINNFSNTNTGISIQFSGDIFNTDPLTALDCSIVSNLLGPPIAACDTENVILDATTVNAIQYDWFRDDGAGFLQISGEHNPTFTVPNASLYRVAVFLNDGSSIFSDVQVAFSATPMTYPLSDDASCSDLTTYDLSQKDTEALGMQLPTDVVVSYYRSMSDAIMGVGSLPKTYPISGTSETIFVRTTSVENPNCFDASQQFQLTALETPMLDFPEEVYLCDGATSVVIGDPFPNTTYSYTWDTGELNSEITVTQAGTYTVTVSNQAGGLQCDATRTVTVVSSDAPQISEVLIDDLQNNNTVTIVPVIDGNFEYQLDGGTPQTGNTFSNVLPGSHQVTVTDLNGCGSVTETITVVGFPKFFTPNGDGANDVWNIEGISELNSPSVAIYDRFGKLLKQLNETSPGWDGTFNGKILPSSDYWFKLSYSDDNGQRIEAKYVQNHFSLRR